jgi:hypothetical protein
MPQWLIFNVILSLIEGTQLITVYYKIGLHVDKKDHLCDLVVRFPGYWSRGLVSIPGATRFSEK